MKNSIIILEMFHAALEELYNYSNDNIPNSDIKYKVIKRFYDENKKIENVNDLLYVNLTDLQFTCKDHRNIGYLLKEFCCFVLLAGLFYLGFLLYQYINNTKHYGLFLTPKSLIITEKIQELCDYIQNIEDSKDNNTNYNSHDEL